MRKKNKKANNRNRNKEMRSIPKRIINAAEIPLGVFGSICRLEVLGNQELYIEGSEKILEYDDNLIVIQAKKMKIKIFGSKLRMDYFNADDVEIKGEIQSIQWDIE